MYFIIRHPPSKNRVSIHLELSGSLRADRNIFYVSLASLSLTFRFSVGNAFFCSSFRNIPRVWYFAVAMAEREPFSPSYHKFSLAVASNPRSLPFSSNLTRMA